MVNFTVPGAFRSWQTEGGVAVARRPVQPLRHDLFFQIGPSGFGSRTRCILRRDRSSQGSSLPKMPGGLSPTVDPARCIHEGLFTMTDSVVSIGAGFDTARYG